MSVLHAFHQLLLRVWQLYELTLSIFLVLQMLGALEQSLFTACVAISRMVATTLQLTLLS